MERHVPYKEMNAKQKRIIERDIGTLFSPKALLSNFTIEDIKRLGIFHPTIRFEKKQLYLSNEGIEALRRLSNLIYSRKFFEGFVSKQDIINKVKECYEKWIERLQQPTGQEFTEEVIDSLFAIVKDYGFLILVEGLDLKDQNAIQLGSVRIQRSDRALMESVKFEGYLEFEPIYEMFKDGLWLIGQSRGSVDIASENFDHRAFLTIGIIAVYGSILYQGAIWRSRVRAVTSPLEHRKAVASLRWEVGGKNPSLRRNWGKEQELSLNSVSIAYLTKECFLEQLASLPDKNNRSDLEDAIIRSLYWFADAYRDRNHIMQFIKLWSCAECFFTIEKEEIAELNAKGIASILAFAGYQIIEPQEYPKFKGRVKRSYDLRSKALHRAKFRHIETSDLNDLSFWIAWVIISMVALSERGYKTLQQVHEQITQLD